MFSLETRWFPIPIRLPPFMMVQLLRFKPSTLLRVQISSLLLVSIHKIDKINIILINLADDEADDAGEGVTVINLVDAHGL